MPNYADTFIITIGGVDIDDVIVDMTEDSDTPTKAVNTMNRTRRIKGYKRGNSTFGLQLSCEQSDNPLMPDWHAIMNSRTEFSILKRPNVGKPVSYLGCTVTKVTDNGSDGDSGTKVSVMVKDRI